MRFTPINFFSDSPTGFRVFSIGGTAHGLFNTIIEMAAQGSALRNKPIVISVTSGTFIQNRDGPKSVAHFYSAVFANEMIFNSPKLFFNDVGDHPSPRGQLYYDWVINAFYHQTLVKPDGTLLNPDAVLSGHPAGPDSHVR